MTGNFAGTLTFVGNIDVPNFKLLKYSITAVDIAKNYLKAKVNAITGKMHDIISFCFN